MNDVYYPRHDRMSAGDALAYGRQELNLTVEDVARHLKLSPAQVEALEAGAYDRLPGRVFVRGFMRNYAKLLQIDPEPLLRSIEYDMPQAAPVDEPPLERKVALPQEKSIRWGRYAALAFAVTGALAVYEFGFNNPARDGATLTDEVAPLSNIVEGKAAGGAQAQASADAGNATTPATPSGPFTQAPLPAPAAPVAAAIPATAAPGSLLNPPRAEPAGGAAPGERRLHFRFEQESWVEVRDRDNKVIFSKLNKAGSEERVSAAPPVKLVVGNARGVRLEYDDKPVDLAPHIGATVARLTLE